jgi:hypothetical protein
MQKKQINFPPFFWVSLFAKEKKGLSRLWTEKVIAISKQLHFSSFSIKEKHPEPQQTLFVSTA